MSGGLPSYPRRGVYPMSNVKETAVELRGISKYFSGTVANDKIDLEVKRGEVLALLGENGQARPRSCAFSTACTARMKARF